MISAAAALIIGLFVCSAQTFSQAGGSVVGQIVDPGLASRKSHRAGHIRNVWQDNLPVSRREAWQVPRGCHRSRTYTVAISVGGFREALIDHVVVAAGSEVDLGKVTLKFAGCDAPGVMCDSFSAEPPGDRPFSNGEIKIPIECAADLDKGRVLCRFLRDHRSDIWLQLGSDNHVYLEARNGARLANPNTAEADCSNAAFLVSRVRVDGLGPSSDLCLRTNEKRAAHISSSRAKYNRTANKSRSST
jgi:hypothetical protein